MIFCIKCFFTGVNKFKYVVKNRFILIGQFVRDGVWPQMSLKVTSFNFSYLYVLFKI